jgi:DNA-binding transcriptional ArsR family regulator
MAMAIGEGAATCEVHALDPERVAATQRQMQPEAVFQDLAATFAAMGDVTRVRILYALSLGELCVCDLAAVLGHTVSAVSHQLRLLRSMRIVKFRRVGRQAYYSLDDHHIVTLLRQGLDHLEDREAARSAALRAAAEVKE